MAQNEVQLVNEVIDEISRGVNGVDGAIGKVLYEVREKYLEHLTKDKNASFRLVLTVEKH